MAKVSRKKFQEALRALKQACNNERLPFTQRIRAAELIAAIYGVPLPENSRKTKRAVRDLIAENAFDRRVRNQVQEKAKRDAEAEAEERSHLQIRGIFDDLLKGTSSQQEATQSSPITLA